MRVVRHVLGYDHFITRPVEWFAVDRRGNVVPRYHQSEAGTVSPSCGRMISGPAGMVWVNVAAPVSLLPSFARPRTEYCPSGNLLNISAIGTSAFGGSADLKNIPLMDWIRS